MHRPVPEKAWGDSVPWAIDEWFLERTARKHVRRLLEPVERRHNAAQTVSCTQYPKSDWNQRFDPGLRTGANMGRIIHDTNWIEADR